MLFFPFGAYSNMNHKKRGGQPMRKTKRGEALVESLRLPQDAVRGETLLTFIGRSTVQIENYRSILMFSDTAIRIQAKRYILCLSGRNLNISYYDRDEMKITGKFEHITFE